MTTEYKLPAMTPKELETRLAAHLDAIFSEMREMVLTAAKALEQDVPPQVVQEQLTEAFIIIGVVHTDIRKELFR